MARRRNPELDLPAVSQTSPVALFWNLVHSPKEYLEEPKENDRLEKPHLGSTSHFIRTCGGPL